VKDQARLHATFATPSAAYLPGTPEEAALVDFRDYGPELTREIRGLTAWLPIKLHGIGAFERALDRTIDLAHYLAAQLDRMPSIEVIRRHPMHLPVVVFRVRGNSAEGQSDLNELLCELICSEGNAYVTTTTLPDVGVVTRACVLSHRTDRATVDRLIHDIQLALSRLPVA
jgi:glutamate/tyrosine decarboxylase-like PLP-dependent enzyme